MVKLPDFLRGYLLRPPSDSVMARSLAASTAETITAPAGATCVVLSCTDNFYALKNGTAAIPADVTDGSASELNPVGFDLLSGTGNVTTISVISPNACIITAAFYS